MSNWFSLPLAELPLALGQSITPSNFPDEEFELYSIPAHETGKPEIVTGREIGSNKQIVEPSCVLLSKINPRINRTWEVGPKTSRRQIASTEWIVFDRCNAIEPGYLLYFLQQAELRDFLAANASGVGGSLMRVKPATLKGFDFVAPGIKTQRKIVEKLEELLSDLDAGVAELKTAQRKLTQYRQSLLKAALEGSLTANWRSARTSSSARREAGADLLQHILAERRALWEAKQLAKYVEQGKTPPKGWQAKYPEPVDPGTKDLPQLPEGWAWASLDALIQEGPQNGLYLPANRYGRGTPILRIDDYQIGWHRQRDALNLVQTDAPSTETYTLKPGDIVINRVNSMTHLGKCLEVTAVLDGVLFESNMMRLHLHESVSASLVSFYLGSMAGRARLIKDAKWAVNQASINQQDVRRTPVPLPSTEEQAVIVEHLEAFLGSSEAELAAIERSLKQAAAQRKNILKAAFAGQLVPQDPNDEPASALLERIRAEGAATGQASPGKRGRKTKEHG